MAGQQLAALNLNPNASPNSPKTLYDLSLQCLIGSMNTKVPALDRISRLAELPRNLLIDVYEMVSVMVLFSLTTTIPPFSIFPERSEPIIITSNRSQPVGGNTLL